VTTWLGERRVAGRIIARIGRKGADLIAEFPQIGTLTASRDGLQVRFEQSAGAPPSAVQKCRETVVDALVRHLQGKITLHGAAVATSDRAIAVIGPSGSGKSTIAATLCTGSNVQLVADDTVALELPETNDCSGPVEVVATQARVWLLPDACLALGFGPQSQKVPVSFETHAFARLSLDAVVALVFDETARRPTLRRLRGQEAFAELAGSVIRFLIDEPEAQQREFDQLRLLMEKCQVFELRRARDLSHLRLSAELAAGLLTFSARS
jgi:hypothetical protein